MIKELYRQWKRNILLQGYHIAKLKRNDHYIVVYLENEMFSGRTRDTPWILRLNKEVEQRPQRELKSGPLILLLLFFICWFTSEFSPKKIAVCMWDRRWPPTLPVFCIFRLQSQDIEQMYSLGLLPILPKWVCRITWY